RNGKVTVSHIGDSRLYHFSKGVLKQITRDQGSGSWVHRALGNWKGAIKDDWQRLSDGTRTPYDGYEFAGNPGDALILCTDGVHGVFSDREMLEFLRDGDEAADIVKYSLDAGSHDNCTAIVARFEA